MEYIKLSNSDGKVWMLPPKELKIGLCLYQPSAVKGRAVKAMLPYINKMPLIDKLVYHVLKIEKQDYEIPIGVQKCVANIGIDPKQVSYSVFLGTPTSIHQKTTVQVSSGKRLLGYCKISDSTEIGSIFLYEKHILDRLELCGIAGVPKCFYAGKIDGRYYFFQSTNKTCKSVVVGQFTGKHLDFLRVLAEKTTTSIKFQDSDFFQDVIWLQQNLFRLSEAGFKIEQLDRAIQRVLLFTATQNRFCVCHGDLTPWNTFSEAGRLFVFDWEYAKETYPPYIDYFHFFTQTAFFEKHWSGEEIYDNLVRQMQGKIHEVIQEPWDQYLQYLVTAVSNYGKRDNFNFSQDNRSLVGLWIELIEIIMYNR